MRRRIFLFMSLVSLLTVGLLTIIFGVVFAGRFMDTVQTGLKMVRVTIVSETGAVVFDNFSDPDTLDNHLRRPEIAAALADGFGQSERYSDTLGEQTMYYAMRLSDGRVLRVALATRSLYALVYRLLPLAVVCVVLVLILSFVAAGSLTRRVVNPINAIDLDSAELEIYDELTPFVRKIEQQRRELDNRLAALNARADMIGTITANMREGLVLIDAGGEILSANTGAQEVFGESEMTGRNILHVCRDRELSQKTRACLSGENGEMAFERNGRTYDVYLSPVHTDGGAVILLLDTTEKYRAEKHRREFSANVSHELKTPLTTISALAEMIGNGMARNEDLRGFGTKISGQAQRLLRIIEDIIRLSEFDEGHIEATRGVFDLYALAESVMTGLRDKADKKNVRLTLTMSDALDTGEKPGLMVLANERMLDELLVNLVDNAIAYNRDGGTVTVRLTGDEPGTAGGCVITVTDTGIGIPAEQQSRVFERFYRVDPSRSKQTGGTGLGLSIVKHIVEYHRGRLELHSAENTGTTVVCYIDGP